MIVLVLNLASCGAGVLLTGFQYGKCVKRRYLEPIEFERELLTEHLDDIRKYRQFAGAAAVPKM